MVRDLGETSLENSLWMDLLEWAESVRIFTSHLKAYRRPSPSWKNFSNEMFKMTHSVAVIHAVFPTTECLIKGVMNTQIGARATQTETSAGTSLTRTDLARSANNRHQH